MKYVFIFVLLSSTLVLAACSYNTDFVVVNTSNQPVEVRYKIKYFPGPFDPGTPKTTTASTLFDEDGRWSALSADKYKLDPEKRTVNVRLMTGQALLIERVHRAGMQLNDAEEAQAFSVEELTISGVRGEVKLEGDKVRKAFVPKTKNVYVLAYEQ